MAIRAAAWVVPVSLAGTQLLMRKGDWTIHPGEVVVRYGPAVRATEYAEDQRDELRQRVQGLVAAGLPEEQRPLPGN
jgi:1-acyl-sn-glycerol-3-phosphate acyltransferase